MEQNVNKELIRTLVAEVEPFWEAFPEGWMRRQIEEDGFFEEDGLRVTWEDAPLGQFYVGLAVLVRDMHFYLIEHPRDDAALFHRVVSMTHTVEASRRGDQAFPDYGGHLPRDQVAALPTGLAEAAAQGNPTLAPLRNPQLVHEWTFKPGKRLYVNFVREFGPGFRYDVCEEKPTVEGIAEKVVRVCEIAGPLAFSLSVCIACPLKIVLDAFCTATDP